MIIAFAVLVTIGFFVWLTLDALLDWLGSMD
jgi:hypothetical protein